MKSIILMAALILSLTACDNTKVRLSAPAAENNSGSTELTANLDSNTNHSIKKDSVIAH